MQIHANSLNSTPRTFSYNQQDSSVMPAATITLDDVSVGRTPATDLVKLRNIHFLPAEGRFEPDPATTLKASSNGDFVYSEGSRDYTTANAFASTAHTVATFNDKLEQLTGKSIHWAFDEGHLGVAPHAGDKIAEDFPNAFYYRPAGNLFFFNYHSGGQATSTGNSGEIVGHEAGHAILDALRPNLMGSFSFEAAAFHEAFGDAVSILMSLEDERTLALAARQTGGDLSNPNIISELGEEMGPAIGRSSVRDARNNFRYVDPDSLPDPSNERVPADQLARESHSFARVWTGAFYELLDKVADDYRARGASPQEALREAGREGWKMLIGQIDNAPRGSYVTFRDMAGALLRGDAQQNGGNRQELIRDVFGGRNILGPEPEVQFATAGAAPRQFELTLGQEFGELAGARVSFQDEPAIFASNSPKHGERIKKDLAALHRNGDILVPAEGHEPTLADFLRPDGSHYHAYLDRASNELKPVLLAG
ncbi:MAG: hypothetical protein AB7S38_09300 [Vulcanimicrobiota bacterium]